MPQPGFGLHPHQGRGAPEIGTYCHIDLYKEIPFILMTNLRYI
jgi:hypothetical protein